jgi:hypothetical protein
MKPATAGHAKHNFSSSFLIASAGQTSDPDLGSAFGSGCSCCTEWPSNTASAVFDPPEASYNTADGYQALYMADSKCPASLLHDGDRNQAIPERQEII